MQKYFNVLVIGGDERSVYVIKQLVKNKATVYAAGFDQISFNDDNIVNTDLDSAPLEKMDAILLPVGGINDNGSIHSTYARDPIYLTKEMLGYTPIHCTLFTGNTNPFLQNIVEQADRNIIRMFARNDVAILNSIPTAEGALKIAMEETKRMIHGSKVLVLGFGRIGRTVSTLFHSVGANVHLASRNSEDLARAKEMKLQGIALDKVIECVYEQQIIINTIPHLVIDKAFISEVDQHSIIIDLASKPGGTDFDFAKEKGIKAIHALGLPGKNAPITAGELIADTLLDWRENGMKNI